MKAVQIKSYGDPLEVLEVVDVPDPGAPGANEALLGIEIATLNKHDLLFIGNALGSGPALPTIVGNEGFGRVLAIGRGVENVKVGDRVSWNSEAGRVRGKIVKVHRRNVNYKGYVHHATADEPQYEIKSDKTDQVGLHKAAMY